MKFFKQDTKFHPACAEQAFTKTLHSSKNLWPALCEKNPFLLYTFSVSDKSPIFCGKKKVLLEKTPNDKSWKLPTVYPIYDLNQTCE